MSTQFASYLLGDRNNTSEEQTIATTTPQVQDYNTCYQALQLHRSLVPRLESRTDNALFYFAQGYHKYTGKCRQYSSGWDNETSLFNLGAQIFGKSKLYSSLNDYYGMSFLYTMPDETQFAGMSACSVHPEAREALWFLAVASWWLDGTNAVRHNNKDAKLYASSMTAVCGRDAWYSARMGISSFMFGKSVADRARMLRETSLDGIAMVNQDSS